MAVDDYYAKHILAAIAKEYHSADELFVSAPDLTKDGSKDGCS